MSGDTWHEDTCHVTRGRELVAGETHVGHMASHVSICMRGDWCMPLEVTCVIHMACTCHVEVKWLMDWLYIWTSSSVHGSAARRKGKVRREKTERKERKERKGREKKKRERKVGKKEMRRGTRTNVTQGAEPDDKGLETGL